MGDLQTIPGVGKNMATHLNALGIERLDDLKGKDPEALMHRIVPSRAVR